MTKLQIINLFDSILDSYVYLFTMYIGWIIISYTRLKNRKMKKHKIKAYLLGKFVLPYCFISFAFTVLKCE